MRPVLLVDTYSLFFRAYHALPPMTTTQGQPTSALYGFSSLLLKLLKEHHPAAVAFAVDAPEKTFRHGLYQNYKAQRTSAPSALAAQMAPLRDLLDRLAVPVFRAPGFEADDILATVARRLRDTDTPAVVVSGDRDLLQLAQGSVRVLFVGARGQEAVLYDDDAVHNRFQVSAQRLPSWIALVGDPSDNLPGVAGVGPRTASSLVQRFGDIPALLRRLDEVTPAKLRVSLQDAASQLELNERLARLRDDVTLPAGPLASPVTVGALDKVGAFFGELEFRSLLSRLDSLRSLFSQPP
ncbi:MAG TPA: 5'-3' exonuclease H3TH domain-containing protein [Polyangia bacterium]|nr:5'-3' exonuclease H3TH domain-containing protein [Polyangia bacterium]